MARDPGQTAIGGDQPDPARGDGQVVPATAVSRELDASEERLRYVLGHLPVALWACDSEGRLTFAGGKKIEEAGLVPDRLVGRLVVDVLSDAPGLVEAVQRALAGEPFTGESEQAGRVLERHITPVWDSAGRPAGAVGIAFDVTERRLAEREWVAAIAQRDYLLRESPVLIGQNDATPPFTTRWVSQNIERLLGHRPEDIVGVPSWLLDRVHPDDQQRALALVSDAMQHAERTASSEFRFLDASGAYRWMIVRIAISAEPDGPPEAMLWYAVDITDRVVAEEERARALDLLHTGERLQSLGQLAGSAAHNINNLLTVIFANVDFIRSELEAASGASGVAATPTATTVMTYLAEIELAAARAATQARRLLTFGRADSTESKAVDLGALLAGLEVTLRRTLGDRIDYQCHVPAGLWPVAADPDDIEQVVLNVATNSRDAMADGGTFAISLANADSAPASGVLMTLADTGIGMAPGLLSRAFEPFFTTKAPGSGTGLGLTSVQDLVSLTGGRVEIESDQGRGTSVRVYLPPAEPIETPRSWPTPGTPRLGRGEIVLVVDGEEPAREAASGILARHGYKPLAVHGGAVALRLCAIESQKIDLLLAAVEMPEMGGVEVASQARASRPGLPVVLVSEGRAPIAGDLQDLPLATPVLTKPFSAQELLRAVDHALDAMTWEP